MHWVTYALGTTVTAVVVTKGAGALTKTGVATTKTAVQKSETTAQNTMQTSRLAQVLPFGRHMHVDKSIEAHHRQQIPVKMVRYWKN